MLAALVSAPGTLRQAKSDLQEPFSKNFITHQKNTGPQPSFFKQTRNFLVNSSDAPPNVKSGIEDKLTASF
jgi:hypothetical protein